MISVVTNGRAAHRIVMRAAAFRPLVDLISAIRGSNMRKKVATIVAARLLRPDCCGQFVAATIRRFDGAAQHHSRGGGGTRA
ncbi:MAG TPA: hypothetical protein VFN27_11720 [Xanthobacteraceae bacterium]|nr:hypothetical protein [Xanthobacteraceae bacterium]